MTAVRCMAAVAMIAGLLDGPVTPPDRSSDRGRHRFCMWHAFTGWFGHRRQGSARHKRTTVKQGRMNTAPEGGLRVRRERNQQ